MKLNQLQQTDDFIHRHIGPSPTDIEAMLQTVGAGSLDELMVSTVPKSILLDSELNLPGSSTENDAIAKLKELSLIHI